MFQLFRFFAVVVRKIDIFLLDAVGKKWSSEVFIIFALVSLTSILVSYFAGYDFVWYRVLKLS